MSHRPTLIGIDYWGRDLGYDSRPAQPWIMESAGLIGTPNGGRLTYGPKTAIWEVTTFALGWCFRTWNFCGLPVSSATCQCGQLRKILRGPGWPRAILLRKPSDQGISSSFLALAITGSSSSIDLRCTRKSSSSFDLASSETGPSIAAAFARFVSARE